MDTAPLHQDSQRPICPACEPDSDPRDTPSQPCSAHQPDLAGAADAEVRLASVHNWQEAGGVSNREACRFIHRAAP